MQVPWPTPGICGRPPSKEMLGLRKLELDFEMRSTAQRNLELDFNTNTEDAGARLIEKPVTDVKCRIELSSSWSCISKRGDVDSSDFLRRSWG